MDRSELEKLAERYQQKADRAFENYQDTGLRRYDTERNNMEDLADALRMAANAAGENPEDTKIRRFPRGSLAEFVNAAQNIKCTTDQDDRVKLVDKLVEDLLAYGRMHNWIAMKG